MCKRNTLLMLNFLRTPVLIHLHQGQEKVLSEVLMRNAESENTLYRKMLFLVGESRCSNIEKR